MARRKEKERHRGRVAGEIIAKIIEKIIITRFVHFPLRTLIISVKRKTLRRTTETV